MIRVLYYAWIREKAGTLETKVEGFSGTLAGLLRCLEEQHGIFLSDPAKETDPDKAVDPLSELIIMINGRHIAHIGGLEAPVADGDTVTIFPLVGGG